METIEQNFAEYLFITLKYIIFGISAIIFGFLLASPLLKKHLLFNPDFPNRLKLFVEVGNNREVAIMKGGNFDYYINDTHKKPIPSFAFFGLWWLFKMYIWITIKVHVYPTFFKEPNSYDLHPRMKLKTIDGKKRFVPIQEGEKGYRSHHVRTGPFTWLFEITGCDVQGIPFTFRGSSQVYIQRGMSETALFLTESWNLLLDQAITSTVQRLAKDTISLSMVIGSISQELWDDGRNETSGTNANISQSIFKELMDYEFEAPAIEEGGPDRKLKLAGFGIQVKKVDLYDMEPEITPAETVQMRSPIISQRMGRAADLTGQGEAKALASIANVIALIPEEHRAEFIKSRAFVDAVKAGGVEVTLMTALVKHFNK